ncbi:MAG: TetR/AcrR family transcriptional regulator [Jiangellaceae bacterium]
MATTTAPTAPPSERHLRADARRNRAKIVEIAIEAFRQQGTAVQMEDIARRAAVGVGTLYRHFPTKEALVTELANRRFGGCIAAADTALGRSDAWSAIECFIFANAEQMATDAGLRDTLVATGKDDTLCRFERGRLEERMSVLLDRARADGAVRADVGVQDIQALMRGLSAAIAGGGDWRRLASIVLAGLRAQGVTAS